MTISWSDGEDLELAELDALLERLVDTVRDAPDNDARQAALTALADASEHVLGWIVGRQN